MEETLLVLVDAKIGPTPNDLRFYSPLFRSGNTYNLPVPFFTNKLLQILGLFTADTVKYVGSLQQ